MDKEKTQTHNFKITMGETLNLNISRLRHLTLIKSSKVAFTKTRQIKGSKFYFGSTMINNNSWVLSS
jgi:hypothetical protein